MSKVVITTGGSGGHLLPAIKTAKHLLSLGYEVVFICDSSNIAEYIVKKSGINHEVLHVKSRSNGLIAYLYSIFISIFRAFNLIRKIDPDAVVGFGSYVSFPGAFASFLLGKPLLIHEQNVVPGKANKIASFFAKKVLISFKTSMNYFNKNKTVFTGCPVNAEKSSLIKSEILNKYGLDERKSTVLVLGGSQGSRRINSEVLNTVKLFSSSDNVQIIHLTGRKDIQEIKAEYSDIKITVKVFDFLDDIGEAYSVSDIIISRAGAVTMLEIAKFNKPAILIPYPYAGNHQVLNAMELEKTGGVVVIEESELSPGILKDTIGSMLDKKVSYSNLFVENAEKKISDEINKVIK